jgi:hypothetical protein
LAEIEKEENFQSIKKLYGQIDFQLLNEHTYITKVMIELLSWSRELGITLRKQEILIKSGGFKRKNLKF